MGNLRFVRSRLHDRLNLAHNRLKVELQRRHCFVTPRLFKLDADGTVIAAQHVWLDEGAFEARAQGF